ncbi:MAG: septum formation initiator family protein, partial [Patescibacteria group bacterium]
MILIVLAVSAGRESYRKYQLTQEIDSLKSEIEKIEGNNQQLANLMDYLKQESYLEKEARLKLNLKKPGEKVVIFSDQPDEQLENTDSQTSPENTLQEQTKEKTANYWKWWEYFF